jgi:hypothetical protein
MRKYFFIPSFVFLVISCDLFTTRVAEDPNQGRSNFQQPYSAEIVIENLKNSLFDKNIQDYLSCFVDTVHTTKVFSFSASSEALALYQMQDWGLAEEGIYINAVLNRLPQDNRISLSLTDTIFYNLGGDSLIYTSHYDLNVPFEQGNQIPIKYSGNLEFKMLRDTRSYWVIYYWKDTKSQTLPSWSELKGNFY